MSIHRSTKLFLRVACNVFYTVGHKNVPLYFGPQLLHFLMDFNTLCTNKNRKNTPSGNYKICNVTTTVSLHYVIKFKNTQNSMTVGDCFLPYVRLNQSCATFTESRCQFLLGYFLNSLVAKKLLHSHRFLIKILSLKLNIRPIIHLHSKHSWRAMWRNYDVITDQEPRNK